MRDLDNLLKLANSIGEETKQTTQLHMSGVDKDVEKMKHHQSLIDEPSNKKPKVENPFEIDQLLANLGIHAQTIPKEQQSVTTTQAGYQPQSMWQRPQSQPQQSQPQSMWQRPQSQQSQPKNVNLAQVAAAVPPRKRAIPTGAQQVKTISELKKPTVAEFEQNAKSELERLSKVTYQLAHQQLKQIDEILSKKELTIEDSQNLAAIISQVNDHIKSQPAAKPKSVTQDVINDADDFLNDLGQDFDDFDDNYDADFDRAPKAKRLEDKKKKNKKTKFKENAEELAKKPLIQRLIQWIVIIVLAIIIGAVASHFAVKFLLPSLSVISPVTKILQL